MRRRLTRPGCLRLRANWRGANIWVALSGLGWSGGVDPGRRSSAPRLPWAMMKRPFRPSLPEPGGFGACSRWLRSAATTPPDRGPQPQPHPGGMPAGARQHRLARSPKRLGLNMFSRRGAGARRRNQKYHTTLPITSAWISGRGCVFLPLLRAPAPPRENKTTRRPGHEVHGRA